MITMTEIASLTGVSQATVSRVLNGNSSVSPETAKKVLDCAKEHQYQPNFIAQSLVGNKTFLIGLVLSDISNPFFAELAKAVESEARNKKYSIILFNTDYSLEREESALEILKRYRADGLLFSPASWSPEVVEKRMQYDMPMVSVTIDMGKIDSVYVSHFEAGEKIARHFLKMGYENFIFAGGKDDDKEKGFLSGLSKDGVNLDKHYFYIDSHDDDEMKTNLAERVCLAKNVGIFAHNDIQAVKIAEILKELKLEIPHDAALAGFDNTFLAKITTPALTSIAQPIEEMGKLAVERLMEKIDGVDKEKCVRYQLDTRLISRGSTIKSNKFID
ncbi:MAG: LacI family transcriptional regulator [Clostridiales bacterium]|nr:LacI family transcriptional regulator [Clostridiales bacterium]